MAPIARASRDFNVCVFIGRFQPLHAGHLWVILASLQHAEFVYIIIGSALCARRPDLNPFIERERMEMILAALPPEARERVKLIPIPDSSYATANWVDEVTREVTASAIEMTGKLEPKIALIGHAKDAGTSYYLKLFSDQWESIGVPSARRLDATMIRNGYFSRDKDVVEGMFKRHLDNEDLPITTHNWLRDFQKTDTYFELVEEMEFYRGCWEREAKESFPGSRNTITCTALIHHSGHFVLGRRKKAPFKGLLCIPGGHLNTDESTEDCALREGYEETGIGVPKIVFERSRVAHEVFQAPRRDPRGRYIDFTYLYDLKPVAPAPDPSKSAAENARRIRDALARPKVRGRDDLADAGWYHSTMIDSLRDQIAFDHYAQIKKMSAYLERK